jgi:hypothetical protein
MSSQSAGSVAFIDSFISNTPIGINTSYDPTSQSPTHGSLILENVQLNNVLQPFKTRWKCLSRKRHNDSSCIRSRARLHAKWSN